MEICISQYAKAVIVHSNRRHRQLKEVHFVDIKEETIKQIEEGFQQLLQQKGEPSCDFSKYVGFGSSSCERDMSPKQTMQFGPTQTKSSILALPKPDRKKYKGWYSLEYELAENKKLIVCPEHLIESGGKVDAVVIPIGSNGHGGDLLKNIEGKINKDYKQIYEDEKKMNLQRQPNIETVFVTGGYGSSFKFIMFAVTEGCKYPVNFDNVYENIIQECRKRKIKSVATILLKDRNFSKFCSVYCL